MGRYVTPSATLAHPDLVRRLAVAASSPLAVAGAVPMSREVLQAANRPASTSEDFLVLNRGVFHESGSLLRERRPEVLRY